MELGPETSENLHILTRLSIRENSFNSAGAKASRLVSLYLLLLLLLLLLLPSSLHQNSIQEEIKIRLKSGNACYHSVQHLLSSSLLLKNIKRKIHGTIILPAVLYGCETWSLTMGEERRLRVFESRVLRTIFGPKTDEVTGEWKRA